MNGPYRIEQDDPGCSECQHGATHSVIGPDDVADSVSYGDYEDAKHLRDACNRAYELGRKSDQPDPWTSFDDQLPEDSRALIVWDAEFGTLSSMYWISTEKSLSHAKAMKYTHWMRADALNGPRGWKKPTEQPLVFEPAPAPQTSGAPSQEPSLETRSEDWSDDIPF